MSARHDTSETVLLVAMQRAGIPQAALRRAVGVAHSTVADHLRGKRADGDSTPMRRRLEDAARRLFQERSVPFPSNPWAEPAANTDTNPMPGAEPMTIPTARLLTLEDLDAVGIDRDPFDDSPGMRLHLSRRTTFNRSALIRAIEQRRMVSVVAPAGGGKSTLLRLLHAQIQASKTPVLWLTPGNLDRSTITEGSLAAAMLRDLNQDVPATAEERGEALRKELKRRCDAGEFPVLVIDEGHDLIARGLIALKRLWDSFTFHRSLAVIIAGQLPLLRTLRHDARVQEVTGRMLVLEIPPMSPADVREYVDHRCDVAGVDAVKLFAEDAFPAIVRRGGTFPLWVNAICQAAIQQARELGLGQVTADAVFAG